MRSIRAIRSQRLTYVIDHERFSHATDTTPQARSALLVLALRRGHRGGAAIAGTFASGIGGVWLLALGGAVVALFVYELLRDPGGEPGSSRGRIWAGSAGGESERLDRNW